MNLFYCYQSAYSTSNSGLPLLMASCVIIAIAQKTSPCHLMSWRYVCRSIPHDLKRPLIVSWRYRARDCIPSFSTGLHRLSGHTDIAVVGLDALVRLEEVAEDLVENSNIIKASGWVGTLDPYQVPPYNTYPNLLAEGRLPRVLVGGEPVPRLCLSCLRDPEISPIDGHQAVVAHVVYFSIFKIDLRLWG